MILVTVTVMTEHKVRTVTVVTVTIVTVTTQVMDEMNGNC